MKALVAVVVGAAGASTEAPQDEDGPAAGSGQGSARAPRIGGATAEGGDGSRSHPMTWSFACGEVSELRFARRSARSARAARGVRMVTR